MNLVSPGLRFGEMERDCLTGDTMISLSEGVSIPIKNMEKRHHNVLGYSNGKNGLINSLQSHFLYKGKKECIKITLEDGKNIECTYNHKLLSQYENWTESKNFKIGDRLKVGLTYPSVNFENEIQECDNWQLNVNDFIFKTNTFDEYKKTLAFCRILGYITTDGSLSENCGRIRLGHKLDVENIISDLNLFQQTPFPKLNSKNCYEINIHKNLLNIIINIKGVTLGKKVNKEFVLPYFIYDDKCPTPIIREFFGAFFGGDGHTCILGMHRGKRDVITSVAFSKSRKHDYTDSLIKTMNDIKDILCKRFDITNVSIQNLKETTHSKKNYTNEIDKCYQSTLLIHVQDLHKFEDKIGFRYCCHKSHRLFAGSSFHRYKNLNKNSLIACDYIKNIGVLDWFDKKTYAIDRTRDSFPTMNLKIINIENIGEQDVYDIQVEDTHSFLANGIVAHNCMISHGTSRFLKERLFEKSDPYTINICDNCGNIATTQTDCKFCSEDKISRVNMPYASKLLVEELMAMNIKILFKAK